MRDNAAARPSRQRGSTRPEPVRLLSRLHPHALGVAAGTVAAGLLAIATIALLLRGGPEAGPHLGLLGQYLPGYRVNWPGAMIGAAYAFVLVYLFAGAFAILRNIAVGIYLRLAWSRLQHHVTSDLLDRMS